MFIYFSGDWDVHWPCDLAFDPWPHVAVVTQPCSDTDLPSRPGAGGAGEVLCKWGNPNEPFLVIVFFRVIPEFFRVVICFFRVIPIRSPIENPYIVISKFVLCLAPESLFNTPSYPMGSLVAKKSDVRHQNQTD